MRKLLEKVLEIKNTSLAHCRGDLERVCGELKEIYEESFIQTVDKLIRVSLAEEERVMNQ